LVTACSRNGADTAQIPQTFERLAPQVGDYLPDVELYTQAGQKISLAELAGQYTVLVFGCLT
jgi:cytochrome oxidase Cu insertion factor (SCO1/SenC/PrrC family)